MRSYVRTIGSAVVALVFVLGLAGSARAAASDPWITTKVKMSLLSSEGVSGNAVNVDTFDGRVTLHGTVASAAEKAKAEQVARSVSGVREVRNLLQAVPPASQAVRESSDADVKTRVEAALAADPALANSQIKVQSVNNGLVLLAGEAKTLSDALRALDKAARVDGVKRVASEIRSPDTLADAEIWREGDYDPADYEKSTARDMWITSQAKMRLMANTDTPAFDINVDTRNGAVTLFGVVESEMAKQQAAAEVKKVSGVREVQNDLQVVAKSSQPAVEKSDAELKSTVEQRLKARDDLDDAKLTVEVSKGVVRLTGSVDNGADHITALTVTRATPGVRRIIDDLALEQPDVSAR